MSPLPRIFFRFDHAKVAYSQVPRRRLHCRGCGWGPRSAADAHLVILDMARFRARTRRVLWHVKWSTIDVAFRMAVNSNVSHSSTAITFRWSTLLVESAGFDEFPLPGLHLDSEQVSVTGLRITVGFEIFFQCAPRVIFFDNVGDMRWRFTRAIGDKLEEMAIQGICVLPEVSVSSDVIALPSREKIYRDR